MGLDVYLYRCENIGKHLELAGKISAEYDEYGKDLGDYTTWTEEQKNAFSAHLSAVDAKYDIENEEKDYYLHRINEDSKIDPEHIFKIGYLRSSYNENGMNSFFFDIGIATLDDVFELEDLGEGISAVNWEYAATSIVELIEAYTKYLETDPLRRYAFTTLWTWKTNDPEALKQSIYNRRQCRAQIKKALEIIEEKRLRAERESKELCDYDWTERTDNGYVFRETIRVKAIMETWRGILVVHEKEDELDGKEDWYLTALKITKEMIDFVLSQPDPQKYFVCWSG